MKKLKFIVGVLFIAFVSSCSSDSSDSSDESTDDSTKPEEAYFNFTYDGKVQKVKSWEAQKQEDFIEVTGQSEEGMMIDFKFNIYGNLYQALTNPTNISSAIPFLEASENFTSNTFTFTLENLNTTDKTVQVKFSGKVYEDAYDYESKFVNVSGSFKVSYKEIKPAISGLGTYAKIEGKDWHGLSMEMSIDYGTSSQIIYVENDGEYTIGIVFPQYHLEKGTFSFTDNTFANRIAFQKYDPATHEYIDYDVSGTVTYSVVNDTYTSGTFSLTATHPVNKTKIVISNGTFTEGVKY